MSKDDKQFPIEIARRAVELACHRLGDRSRRRRATIGYFALIGARAGNHDVAALAGQAIENADAEPNILGDHDPT